MKGRLALTALIVLVVAGCGLFVRPGSTRAKACPIPTGNTQLLKNEANGYCLLYPVGYKNQQPNPNETVFFAGSPLNVEAGRAYIEVRDAGGRAASEIAGGIVAEAAANLPGWGIRRGTATVGGETAMVLDNVPGQDIGRQVVMVHGDRLYLMTFVPADPAQGEAYQGMENLYKTVVESLRFTS